MITYRLFTDEDKLGEGEIYRPKSILNLGFDLGQDIEKLSSVGLSIRNLGT